VFGLGKPQQDATTAQQAAQAAEDGNADAHAAGKGRPTPKRRDAEQLRRNPVVRTPAQAQLSKNASKAERKVAKVKDREARRLEAGRRRQALMTGEEKYLPERDKGPVRRWVRDYVDARMNVGQYFIPAAVVIVVMGLFRALAVYSMITLYALLLVVVIDSVLLRRRLKKLTIAKFGEQQSHGAATYGMMRALQIRRTRLPRPQVSRGQYPT
jgi:hypothetical protein